MLCILLGISVVVLGGSLLYQYIYDARPASLVISGDTSSDSAGNGVNIQNPENTGDNFAIAPGNIERIKLALYRGHSEEKYPFKTAEMLPGDKEYRAYELSVTYSGTVVVRFCANITLDESVEGHTKGDPDAKLADALIVRIDIEGKTVYEGAFSNIPKELTYTLSSKEKTVDYIDYDVYAWLPKGADEAYQQKRLEAEFCWWVAGGSSGSSASGQLEDSPETGAPARIIIFAAIAAASLLGIIALCIRSRKKRR